MRIERVDLRDVHLPLLAPFEASHGTVFERRCIIVTVHAGGCRGYGECVAAATPSYTPETIVTAWHLMQDFLIPVLLLHDLDDPGSVSALFRQIRGHPMAKAALEMACWDLVARAREIALWRLLGGGRERIPVGVSVGLQPSPEHTVATVSSYVECGYGRVKLKIEPGRDSRYVKEVRARFPALPLQVDGNAAYTLEDATILQDLDQYDLLLLEQPLDQDDIIDHARLQTMLTTPVCLDESIETARDARQALEIDACRVINIKPGRVGGHEQSRRIHDLSLARGCPVWCGGMLETNIGRAHNVALASLPGFTLPGDISASNRYYARDIAGPDFTLGPESTLRVPTGPGIGVEIDSESLENVTSTMATFV